MTKKELKALIKEIVNEVSLDRSVDDLSAFKNVSDQSKMIDFKVDDMEYKAIAAEKHDEEGNLLLAKFSFINMTEARKVKDSPNATDTERLQSLFQWHRAKYGLTKTGKQMRVFNKIYNIFTKYVEMYKPKYIGYQANEENRQELYDTRMKRASKQTGLKFKKLDDPPLGKEFGGPNEFFFEMEYS